jgi:hypothetical protein
MNNCADELTVVADSKSPKVNATVGTASAAAVRAGKGGEGRGRERCAVMRSLGESNPAPLPRRTAAGQLGPSDTPGSLRNECSRAISGKASSHSTSSLFRPNYLGRNWIVVARTKCPRGGRGVRILQAPRVAEETEFLRAPLWPFCL